LRASLLIAGLLVVGCVGESVPAAPTPAPPEDPGADLAVGPARFDPIDLSAGDDDDDDDDDVALDDDDVAPDDDDDVVPVPPCPEASLPAPTTTFADVSTCAGVTIVSGAEGGVAVTGQAWGDTDGDGDLDLFLTDPVAGNTLLLGDGGGTFTVAPDAAPLALVGSENSGATFADYDGDGDPDLYVLAKGPNHLLRNDGAGGWTDVTDASGTGDGGHGMSAAWADFDADGDLDLYVASYECVDCAWLDPDAVYLDRLFQNQGDGTFEDASSLLGLDLLRGDGYAAVWFDYDDDADPDLYVVNDRGNTDPWTPGERLNRNLLFRNDGPGCDGWCFSEVAEALGADLRVDGMGVAVSDFDNDGDLDLAVSDGGPPNLLANHNGQGFVDVTIASGVDATPVGDGWGLAFLDYDNDGDADLYMAEAIGGPAVNRLFENDGDGTFTELGEASGAWDTGHSIGVAVADYDNDGALDFVVGNREAEYQLFRNLPGTNGNGWLRLRLEDGVGARAYVTSSLGDVQMQEVKVGSSVGSSHDPALHFGLLGATIDQVEVVWPDGDSVTLASPGLNLEIVVPRP